MSDANPQQLPSVPRFNPWGEWNPIVHPGPLNDYVAQVRAAERLCSPGAQAAYKYCVLTKSEGIEFVLLSRFVDKNPYRRLPNGIILVPCANVLSYDDPSSVHDPAWFIYDGWMPLADTDESTILAALSAIEETVAALGFCYEAPTRWVQKYIELSNKASETRQLTDEDVQELDNFVVRTNQLPAKVKGAVNRSVHWLQHADSLSYSLDRFLALYFALEGLCEALWAAAPQIGLPIESTVRKESNAKKKERISAEIREILNEELDADPEKAIQRAYFDAVKGLRRRVELVLHAAFVNGAEFCTWLYNGRNSPSKLRSALAHGSQSGLQAHEWRDLPGMCDKLRGGVASLIRRTLHQQWGTPMKGRTITVTATMTIANSVPIIPNGGWRVEGNFEISLALLSAKGLL